MQKIIIYISTCFRIGFLPKAPGTFGSLLAVVFVPLLFYSSLVSLLLIVALFVIGAYSAGRYATIDNSDPSEVVIDELVGQFLTFYLVNLFTEITFLGVMMSFILFRVCDIIKPWPICYFDKNIKGGFGIMFDDVLAAIMASFFICIIINII